MKIRLERSGKVLKVIFSGIDLDEKQLEGGLFRRRYGSSRGVTFTFEKSAKVLFLYVSFDRYKDAGVLKRIGSGRPVEELQMLSKLAHLPCAKLYVSEVPLPDGRNVNLIDTIKFELRKIADGIWESRGTESEVDGLRRQMTLKSLKDGLPGFYLGCGADMIVAGQAGSETIFARRVKELKTPQTKKDLASAPKFGPGGQEKAPSERVLGPIKRSDDLPKEEEPGPQVNPAVVSEDRDPNEIAACDGCEELCYERELIEIKPGLYVCNSCTDDDTLRRLGLTPDEIESFWRLMRCDWCGQPLTEMEPGRWLCPGCSLQKEAAPLPSALEVEGMRWLETRFEIPVGQGKVIPAGKWIIGTSAADGWKIGAEYSDAVECIWRERKRAYLDKGNIIKVDANPSIVIPNGAVSPGGTCLSGPIEKGPVFGKDDITPEFKKPTATDINKAIQLLLWRCRDAKIHEAKPQGKRGFYGLDDWIAKANDDMIRELGLWCADIQELNIGTRDS
jgi:hypothetical protein